jgi:hypothetical protein
MQPVARSDHSVSRQAWKSGGVMDKHKESRKFEDISVRADDKVNTLLAYRKAKGLCYKCGDKWAKNHTCPPQVPIQVSEELFSILQLSEYDSLIPDVANDSDDGPELMAIQDNVSPQFSKVKKRTLRLQGCIGNQYLLQLF